MKPLHLPKAFQFSIMLLFACGVTICGAQEVGQGLDSAPSIPRDVEEMTSAEPVDLSEIDAELVETILESLTLDQKIMQLMFVRLSGGLAPSSVDNTLLEKLPPGGIILPTVGGTINTIDYVRLVRKMESKSSGKLPFFIAGNVFAFSGAASESSPRFLHVPSMLSLSAAGDNVDTVKLFETIADDFHRMGINTHFGPSLTLSSDLDNSRGTLNTFGGAPSVTATLGSILLDAFDDKGVLWMPSGFPGGEANRSRSGPATMLTMGNHYLERDGLPYLVAIKNGVQMIHVANTLAPTIDGDLTPSSMSRKVITTLLRGAMNYDGLVIAGPMDDLQLIMKYEPELAAVQSLLAGADMLLWGKTSPQIPKAIGRIAHAVKVGELSEDRIDESVRRILLAKNKFGLFEREEAQERQAEKIRKENAKLGAPELIEKRAITLLRNSGNLLPFKKDLSTPLFITGVMDLDPLVSALKKKLKHVNYFGILTAKHTTRVQDFEFNRLARMAKGVRTALCVFNDNVDQRTQAQVIAMLKKESIKVVVVLIGNPRNIYAYRNADALVAVYGSPKNPEKTLSALSDILLGNAPIRAMSSSDPLIRAPGQEINFDVLDVIQSPTGRLPFALEPDFPVGHFVSYAPTSIDKVRWDFGDGTKSNEERIGHRYDEPGRYTASVVIWAKDGTETTGTFEIEIR